MLCLKGFSWCLILLIDLQSITHGEIVGRFIVPLLERRLKIVRCKLLF